MDAVKRVTYTAGLGDSAIGLLLALFASAVYGLIYASLSLRKWTPTKQHLYFILTGVSLAYYCYRLEILHSIISQLVVYLVLQRWPGTSTSVIAVWTFSMVYLLAGYVYVSGERYIITWTLSQCVLTLKFIGTASDLRDGYREFSKDARHAKVNQPNLAIKTAPTLLEWLGYCFFPGTLFVGPSFPFRRYKYFVEGRLFPTGTPSTLLPTLKSMLLGVAILGIHLGLSGTFPASYFLTDDYAALSVVIQLFYIFAWIKVYACRYVGIWLISDSACIASGMGYNGIEATSQRQQWNALSNIDIYYLETDVTLTSGPRSFNVLTNLWIMRYVYKRLRFLGSKIASLALSMTFITVWHGIHAGYFLTFLGTELPLLVMERVSLEYASRYVQFDSFSTVSKGLLMASGYIWRWTAVGYAIMPFEQKRLDRGLRALQATHFFFHIVFIVWVACVVVCMILARVLGIGKHGRSKGSAGVGEQDRFHTSQFKERNLSSFTKQNGSTGSHRELNGLSTLQSEQNVFAASVSVQNRDSSVVSLTKKDD